jgi:serine protease
MSRSHRPSDVRRRALALSAASVLGCVALAAVTGPAGAAPADHAVASTVWTVPTAAHHGYRHGAVPRRTHDVSGVAALGSSGAPAAAPRSAPASRASTRKLLTYGGGLTAGGLVAAGVTTGQPKVYLVFMGSQWGTESTNGAGQQVFSGDPDALAPALQTLYAGIGTGGETWSGVLTQYCDGAPVGATSCTEGDTQIPYPSGGVLSGIWYDPSSSATSEETAGPSGHDLATEAELAAAHFGDTDQASNRDTQYVIVSPTGADPDGWSSPTNGYCAYHDDSHDPSITGGGPVTGPIVAFTNLPYVPDAGADCGAGTVNSPGVLDGATEAASHEYAETMTDQFPEADPPGGWSNAAGEEDGDLCAYVSSGPGAMFNLVLATGTVAVQGTWSNRADACSDGEPTFTYSPEVSSFTPARAVAGSPVTISGTNLGDATVVSFAGTPATITGTTSTSVTVVVPAGAADGTLSVTTPAGTATSAKSFSLVPSIGSFAPTTVSRGATLTIAGSGLGSLKKVLVGGKKAVVVSDTPTQIVVTVPSKATSGSVTVSTRFGTATLAGLTVS